jgi:hypothetical protein
MDKQQTHEHKRTQRKSTKRNKRTPKDYRIKFQEIHKMKTGEILNTQLDYAIWCDMCGDWKTDFIPDNSGLWILCNDCNNGLIKVI